MKCLSWRLRRTSGATLGVHRADLGYTISATSNRRLAGTTERQLSQRVSQRRRCRVGDNGKGCCNRSSQFRNANFGNASNPFNAFTSTGRGEHPARCLPHERPPNPPAPFSFVRWQPARSRLKLTTVPTSSRSTARTPVVASSTATEAVRRKRSRESAWKRACQPCVITRVTVR